MKKIFTIIMSAALIVSLAIPTFAASIPSNLPSMPSTFNEKEYTDYFVIETNEGIYLYMYKSTGTPLGDTQWQVGGTIDNWTSVSIKIPRGYDTTIHSTTYKLNNDFSEWQLSSEDMLISGDYVKFLNLKQIITSTKDWYQGAELVFHETPSTSQILMGEVRDLVVKPMMKTLLILVPCGVGLMALLLCLPILRKVFYLFQVK